MSSLLSDLIPNISHEAVFAAFIALCIWSAFWYLFLAETFVLSPRTIFGHRSRSGTPPRPAMNSTPATSNPTRRTRATRPGPQVMMAAGPDSVSIVVGKKYSLFSTSGNSFKEQLGRLCTEGFDGFGIKVEAELQEGKFGIAGFLTLGEHVQMLAGSIGQDRWAELVIHLPNETLLPLDSQYAGDKIEPPNLQRLTWTGPHQQLTNSWFPFTPKTLRPLTRLVLQSTISVQDCERLLIACSNLTEFEVHWLADVESALDLHRSATIHRRQLPFLVSFTLSSRIAISDLLQNFKFSQLERIALVLDYPNVEPHALPWQDWQCLRQSEVRSRDMHLGEANTIRRIRPAAHHALSGYHSF